MGRIGLAFRIFFRTLFSIPTAGAVAEILAGGTLPKITTGEPEKQPDASFRSAKTVLTPPIKRSDALTLLASLQREARLVDLLQEPLDNYSNEQVGAAARNVLQDSAGVLERFFALRRVVSEAEGETSQVPSGYDPGRYKLSGNVQGSPPFTGKVVHAGWIATTINLPSWTGSKDTANIVAPAEVEV